MRSRRGGALIVTLAVMAGLLALVVSFASLQRQEQLRTIAEIESRRAQGLAWTGIQRAMAELANVDENAASLADEWAQLGEYRGENFVIADGSVRFEILDEGSLVNLNTAGQDQLLNLGLTTEQVDSLLDWREAGDEPRPEGGKDEYYNSLPTPYNAALAPLRSLDELMLVRGFTARSLFELPEEQNTSQPLVTSDPETQPVLANLATVWSIAPWTRNGGQARLNANTASQQQLVQAGIPANVAQAIIARRNTLGTFTALGQVLSVNGVSIQNAPSILNNLSTNASTQVSGRLNLNTAVEAALNSLPGSSPDITQAILTRQQQTFASLGDLASVPGVTLAWLQQNVDQFAVGTMAFRVRAIGAYKGQRSSVEAVITIESGAPRILGVYRSPEPDMASRWLWPETTTADVELVAP